MENEFNKVVDNTTHALKAGQDVARAGLDHAAQFDAPGHAREYVQKTADIAKGSAADIHANATKVTHALESRLVDVVGEAAKAGREWQETVFKDTEAFWTHVGKLASSKNVSEAMGIQSEFVRERSETLTARARSAGDLVAKMMTETASAFQENASKVQSMGRAA